MWYWSCGRRGWRSSETTPSSFWRTKLHRYWLHTMVRYIMVYKQCWLPEYQHQWKKYSLNFQFIFNKIKTGWGWGSAKRYEVPALLVARPIVGQYCIWVVIREQVHDKLGNCRRSRAKTQVIPCDQYARIMLPIETQPESKSLLLWGGRYYNSRILQVNVCYIVLFGLHDTTGQYHRPTQRLQNRSGG